MLFCIIKILSIWPNIVLCFFLLYWNVKMLKCYNIMIYVTNLCRILLYCCFVCNNFVLWLVMLVCNIILLFFNVTVLCCVLLSRFVMLYCYFIRYNAVLCLVMLFCNDATLFCTLQYFLVSYQIVLQSHNLFCFLPCCFVML